MFFSTFILVPIYREHDSLQQSVNLGHCNKTAEVCNMSRLGLQEKKQISVFLRLFIVGKESLLNVCRIF